MKDIDTINHFISLRSAGFTYEEIKNRIGVSKPTLVKWNKKYDNDIRRTSRYIYTKLFSLGLYEDRARIIIETEILIKYTNKEYGDIFDDKDIARALDFLANKFARNIKSINFNMTKYGRIKEITYSFVDEE